MITKVCGCTENKHIDWAIELGYDAIGIVLHPASPRFCHEKDALNLIAHAGKAILTVAVGLTFNEIKAFHGKTDYVQIYEEINIDKLIYAGKKIPEKISFDYFMYDVSKGSGTFHELPDWLHDIKDKLFISGGLTIENINSVLKNFHCAGIDVSSGVEKTRGIKDYELMKKFITEVHNAIN